MKKKTGQLIVPGGYGDPRAQAEGDVYDSSLDLPGQSAPRPIVSGMRRTGTSLSSGASTGSMGMGGGNAASSMAQSPLFYDYRWSTPDKFYFPRNRVVANSIWREMYKRDPAIATATDMYAELPWSEFDMTGLDDPGIRRVYEDMFNALNLVPKFTHFTRDYLITGELILHNIFNNSRGIWERTISHNPDYVDVVGMGMAVEQPLLWLRPTPEIQRLLVDEDPRVRKLRNALPRDLLNSFRQKRKVPLDPLNTTYIPRINLSSDIRGWSLYTRLYRVVMYEDFIVNASLAVAQRNAAPLRIFKLGDPNSGWLPDAEDEAAFAEMLSIAESDPLAAIVMHQHISAELVGVSDRVLLISREWDFIERVKLLGLGVSKSFLVGEASFAAAVAGLQTLLERLATLRNKFEKDWMIKKICEPIAQIHEFYKRPESELAHRLRIKKPEDMDLIVPKIKWRKTLEPTQDVAILNVWRDMKERGLVSDRTYSSGAGLDLDAERKNLIEEKKYKEEHSELYGLGPAPPQGTPRPAAPGMPGGAPPLPGGKPPGASGKHRRYGSDNPYVVREVFEDIEAGIEEFVDSENRIHVDDLTDVLANVKDDKSDDSLAEVEARLPSAGIDLLAGS